MMKKNRRPIALGVTLAFLTLLSAAAMPLPAAQAPGLNGQPLENADTAPGYIEKEQQAGFQARPRNVLPILLGVAAVTAGVFLLVILISKVKYDVGGVWEFHNHFTTAGDEDYDSVWNFTPYDDLNPVNGFFVRNANGVIIQGQFTIVNKKEVVFQFPDATEQYVGQFDSKTAMSGSFVVATGAKGTWTAKRK